MRRRLSRARDRISLAFGAGALGFSVLGIGGALRWTQAIVAGLVAIAVGLQLFARRRLERASPIVWLIGIAIGLTAIQLVPLPHAVVHSLDAAGDTLRADGAAIAGTQPWETISLDPPGTLRALAFFAILLGVALLALRFSVTERGRFVLLAGVAGACGLAAAVTGVHALVSADSLYGLYEPVHASPPVLGPLLNPNHLGGLMAVGAILAIGLAFYRKQPSQLRVVWILVASGCVSVALASQSRGATIGLALGLAFAFALLVVKHVGAREGRRRSPLTTELPLAIVVMFGVGLAVYMSAGTVADKLDDTSMQELNAPVSKYAAWKSSVDLLVEAPWLGIGRGAIEPALTRVQDASAYVTFSHLENEYLSAVVEWGVPGAIALAIALGACLVGAFKRWRDGPLGAAALGALAAILFQSSVDFGVELLGVAVPVTIVLCTLVRVPLREAAGGRDRGAAFGGRLALVVGLALAALALLRPATRSLQEDHDEMLANPRRSLADLRPQLERHPLDYFGFGQAAVSLVAEGDPRTAKFVNHALTLHPTHPGLHRLAARMLLGVHDKQQAALEYSLAMHGTLAPAPLLTEIIALLPAVDDAASAIPVDYAGRELIQRTLTRLKRPDIAEHWLARVAMEPAHDVEVIDAWYSLATTLLDWPSAERAARLRLSLVRTTTSKVMLARVLPKRPGTEAELAALVADVQTWQGRIDDIGEAWLISCDLPIAKRDWDSANQCLHRLDVSGMLPPGGRDEITKRLRNITDQRAADATQKQIDRMEAEIKASQKSGKAPNLPMLIPAPVAPPAPKK